MSIQLNTESLTKSRHFISTAFKIVWQNKTTFLALAILPALFMFLGNQFTPPLEFSPAGTLQSSTSIPSLACTLLAAAIFGPLSQISWFRLLLDSNYTLTIKSYFTFDKRFFKYIICNILLMLFCVLAFAFALAILMLFAVPLISLSKDFLISNIIGIAIAAILLLVFGCLICFYYVFPSSLALPFLALNKPVDFVEIPYQSSPYRSSFFRSGAVMFLMLFLIMIPLIASQVMSQLGIGNYMSMIYAPLSFILYFILCFFSGTMWTLYALYYKKYLAEPSATTAVSPE